MGDSQLQRVKKSEEERRRVKKSEETGHVLKAYKIYD